MIAHHSRTRMSAGEDLRERDTPEQERVFRGDSPSRAQGLIDTYLGERQAKLADTFPFTYNVRAGLTTAVRKETLITITPEDKGKLEEDLAEIFGGAFPLKEGGVVAYEPPISQMEAATKGVVRRGGPIAIFTELEGTYHGEAIREKSARAFYATTIRNNPDRVIKPSD